MGTPQPQEKAHNETAAHVFRFVLRKDMDDLSFSEASEPGPITTSWPNMADRPDDVIMINKVYIASTSLSQNPCVFCPTELMEKLDIKPVQRVDQVS